ncbi:lantibiotic dehydratase, partial [Chryseobacterium sp.]|uniref:lantibiotic dehydratase n=1 Tax=Chryseobacterium sp. TaxID=1871047 RepID=UPI0025C404B0
MSRFSYRFFDEYVFRTPLFSCRKFLGKTEKLLIESDDLKLIFSDSAFQEAVLLASPYLHKEMLQWLNSEKAFSSKEFQKLKNTLLKYYSRMSTRCTPFGLFSQVGLGVFDDEKEFSSSETKIIRDTKLDMHFLVALSQNLTKKPEIKNQLLFFPNNSIYKIGTKIRYIEYEYTKGKRDYIISSVPLSKELDSVLGFLQKGRTVGEIVDILINEEITREDAIGFIDELIDNQIIVSELEPNVSGNDFLEKLIATLNRIGSDEEAEVLKLIQGKLIELDQNIGNSISGYKEIENFINRSFDIEYEQKFLFQTDLYS